MVTLFFLLLVCFVLLHLFPRLFVTVDPICNQFVFCWILRDRKEVYLGDDNSLTLTFNARNEGEGGAYEAELYVVLPPEADYSGIARNNEVSGTAKANSVPHILK